MLNITGNKKIFLSISVVLMLVSIVSLIVKGFNRDTDFVGGMAVTYTIKSDFEVKDVEDIVSEALGTKQKASSVQKSESNDVIVKFGYDNSLKTEDERSNFATERIAAITKSLTDKYKDVELKNQDVVSPSTGIELARSAMWMSILAALAILVYVTFRFEFVSGLAAVLALVHDILILCGIYSVFQIAIDTNFIAALLTVLGYSINNTIVVFDRVRENTRHAKKQTYSEIANTSINQTLGRSINTTITTLITLLCVYFMGVLSIKAFTMPIIIGIVIGTYSSIFCAAPVWAMWRDLAVKAKKA